MTCIPCARVRAALRKINPLAKPAPLEEAAGKADCQHDDTEKASGNQDHMEERSVGEPRRP